MTSQRQTTAPILALLSKALLIFGIILLTQAVSPIQAQAPNDNGSPLGMAPGAPEGSYALSGFENINLYNGSLSFSFPVQPVGGRGAASYTAQVPIDLKWMVTKYEWYDEVNQVPVTWYYPSVAEFYGYDYSPGMVSVRYSQWKPEDCYIGGDLYTTFRWASAAVVFKGPDGTEYELVDQATGGQPMSYPPCSLNGLNRGTVFVSKRQPGMTFISDIQIGDAPYFGFGRIAGLLKFPDGTVYRYDEIPHCSSWGCWYSVRLAWIRDANGNKTTFGYTDFGYGDKLTSIKDSLNRQITIEYNLNQAPYGSHDKLTYKGFGGANRVVRIQRGNLSSALRSGFSIQTAKQLFPTLDGDATSGFDPGVTTAIWLPDSDGVTRRYRFFYNSYSELARVELPTGGAIEYDWGPGLSNGAASGIVNPVPNMAHWMELDESMPQIYRRVVTRRAYDTGNVLLGSTTYSKPESQNLDNSISNGGYVTVGHLNATGQQLSAESHYFYGSPTTSMFTWQASPQYLPTYSPFATYRDGREYQTDSYGADGQTLLRRSVSSWDQPAVSWWSWSADSAPANCPYVKQTVKTLSDSGQVTKTTNIDPQTGQVMIDQFGNTLDEWIYDYGQGQPGALLRRMHNEYLTVNPINGVNYTNRTSASSPHKLNLLTRTSIYDANGIERARTTVEYDNYAVDSGHAALVNRLSMSGFDTSFNTSYTARGNPTATTRYFLTNGSVTGSITGYSQYDIAGNVVKAIDPRGNPTLFDYADRFGAPNGDAQANTSPTELSSVSQNSYGFATLVTNALGHTAFTQYDYHTGKPVDSQDANGTTYSGYYNDALDRPTQVISGANRDVSLKRQTLFSYNEAARTITTTNDFNSFNEANPQKSETLYDGMGRTTETRRYETVSTFVATRQQYDSLGRVFKVSNPFRDGETPVWTTTSFDALSRTLSITTPDNAVASNSYSGNSATATEQAGKKRRSITDALNRLVTVYEDPNGVNYQTSYGYDVLDNLITVTQDTQTRTFVYDSLNRVISSTNPENGTATNQYDNNGNLTQRTDARGVVTTITYDVLNRPTTKTHQNDGGVTPALAYFYDSQSLPSGAPAFNRGYSTGRLVAMTYGGGSTGDYFGYDAKGRGVLKIQRTGSVNYQISATFNVSGSVVTTTYPSGHTTSYTYDAAGRTSAFSGDLGDGTQRDYSTGISYAANGAWTREQFGTQIPLYNKRRYNVRQQLYDMRLSTVNDLENWNRGAVVNYYSLSNYGFGTTGSDTNGNVYVQQHWVPNNDAISSYSLMQQNYGYDSLNRLSLIQELQDGTTNTGSQSFSYDRWGNRTVSAASGTGINNKPFSVNTTNNRLTVPAGQSGSMTYDNSGNLTNDTYSGQGQRIYDANHRMVQAWANSLWQTYVYDADGKRIKTNVNGSETWDVYGLSGELIAEYSAAGSPSSPNKEYGYRNGELLVVLAGRRNVALAANGGVATASSTATANGFSPSFAINGNNRGPWGNYLEGWNDNTPNSVPDWIQIDFAGSKTINEIDVFSLHDNYTQQNTPTETQTFSLYGLLAFEVQYWNGSSWVTVPGGSVSGNNKVWRKFTFSNISTSKIRVYINAVPDAWSRVVEIQAFEPSTAGERIDWLVTDQLGTPRMIADKTGSLSGISRHDYLPFGEELYAGTGGRTTGKGYSQPDGLRQQFTGYERDIETGLDYAKARYFSNVQGRFTGVDPISGRATNPQTWNGYTYSGNNPLRFVDPSGMNYFVGGGVNDPFIREFRVDGFNMGPEGTTSMIEESPMLAEYVPHEALLNEGMAETPAATNTDTPAADTDQPTTLTDTDCGCSLKVRYLGSSTTNLGDGYTGYGAEFIVSGTVTTSRVGRVGDPDAAPAVLKAVDGDLKNGGQWVVGQWIYPIANRSTWSDGKPQPPHPYSPTGTRSDDSPRPHSRNVQGRNFWWHDTPGYYSGPDRRLVSGYFSANFTVYAYQKNTNNACKVSFHLEGRFDNGRWSTSIGPLRR